MFSARGFEVYVGDTVVVGGKSDVEGEQKLCEGDADDEHRKRTPDAFVTIWQTITWLDRTRKSPEK